MQGYGLIGSIEEISIKELKAQFETNLFGVMSHTTGITYNEKSKRRWRQDNK